MEAIPMETRQIDAADSPELGNDSRGPMLNVSNRRRECHGVWKRALCRCVVNQAGMGKQPAAHPRRLAGLERQPRNSRTWVTPLHRELVQV